MLLANLIWLVVSTHLKNISQIGSFPQIGMQMKNIWNHHLDPPSNDSGQIIMPKDGSLLWVKLCDIALKIHPKYLYLAKWNNISPT